MIEETNQDILRHPKYAEEKRKRKVYEWRAEEKTKEVKELRRQVTTDALTDILNRRGFEARMRATYERRRAKDKERKPAFAFVMVDTDKFKNVNDTLGHPMGDEVLKTLAAYLQSHVRNTDVVCRQGGEEFLIALDVSEVDQEKIEEVAVQYADKLRRGIEELDIHLPGQDTNVTVSMGVADGSSAEAFEGIYECIEAADKALYTAKNGGRNQVVLALKSDKKPVAER